MPSQCRVVAAQGNDTAQVINVVVAGDDDMTVKYKESSEGGYGPHMTGVAVIEQLQAEMSS